VPITKKKVSPFTISEAQLIGRGARYNPFKISESDDEYKRKFDEDTENDLRILEELYFHIYAESTYISDLRQALIEEGLIDENICTKKINFKRIL
jgi:type III restriction enzyme